MPPGSRHRSVLTAFSSKSPKLAQLLTDPAEIGDLLESYGVEAPASPSEARAKLLTILDGVGEEAVLRACYELAGDFSRMASDITNLFAGFGVTGQIQLDTTKLDLPSSGLDSSWAFSGTEISAGDVELRAEAIAVAIKDAATRIESDGLLSTESREETTSYGDQLRADPLTNPIWRSISGSVRSEYYNAGSENDLRLLKAALADIEIQQSQAPFAPPIRAAMDTWLQSAYTCITLLESSELTSNNPSPRVVAACDDVRLMAQQARQLAEETAEAERVEGGFRDFLRTDFWFQRWRVYELWVLARVLGVLRLAGGEVRFLRTEGGVWNLSYGRDESPVACATFPNGNVDVFYQYFEKVGEGADMPDIALRDGNRSYLAVIDPKHGKSYRREVVERVLRRYDQHFRARLTAIVNYYPMPSYPFNGYHIDTRQVLLTSDLRPGSTPLRRFEIALEDVLLAHNLGGHSVLAAGPPAKPKQKPPRAGVLVYYAERRREVDEPSGTWTVTEQGVASHADLAEAYVGKDTELLDAAPGGEVCIVVVGTTWTLLHARMAPKPIVSLQGTKLKGHEVPPGWDPQGSHYAVCKEGRLTIIDNSGGTQDCRLVQDEEEVLTVGWTASGESLICEIGRGHPSESSYTRFMRHVQVGSFILQDYPLVLKVEGSRSIHLPAVHPLGGLKGTLVRTSRDEQLCLTADEKSLSELAQARQLIAVSPSGKYQVSEGPQSLHSRDGVKLLHISVDQTTVLPLMRYSGWLLSPLRWSPDESRFAFVVRRSDDVGQRLMLGRPGDRFATPVSLPEQIYQKCPFAWFSPAMVRRLTIEKKEIDEG